MTPQLDRGKRYGADRRIGLAIAAVIEWFFAVVAVVCFLMVLDYWGRTEIVGSRQSKILGVLGWGAIFAVIWLFTRLQRQLLKKSFNWVALGMMALQGLLGSLVAVPVSFIIHRIDSLFWLSCKAEQCSSTPGFGTGRLQADDCVLWLAAVPLAAVFIAPTIFMFRSTIVSLRSGDEKQSFSRETLVRFILWALASAWAAGFVLLHLKGILFSYGAEYDRNNPSVYFGSALFVSVMFPLLAYFCWRVGRDFSGEALFQLVARVTKGVAAVILIYLSGAAVFWPLGELYYILFVPNGANSAAGRYMYLILLLPFLYPAALALGGLGLWCGFRQYKRSFRLQKP